MEHNRSTGPGGLSETGRAPREVVRLGVSMQGEGTRSSSSRERHTPAVYSTNEHLSAPAPTGNEGQRQTGQGTTYNLALEDIFGDPYGGYGQVPMTYGAQQQRSARPNIPPRVRSRPATTPYSARPDAGSQMGLSPMQHPIGWLNTPTTPVQNYGSGSAYQRLSPNHSHLRTSGTQRSAVEAPSSSYRGDRNRSSGVRPADTGYQTGQQSTSGGRRWPAIQPPSAVASASMSYLSNQYAYTSPGFIHYPHPMQGNMGYGYGTQPNQQGLPVPPHLQVQYPGSSNYYQYQYHYQYGVPNHQSVNSPSYGSNHPPTLPPQTLPLVPRSAPTQTQTQSAPGLRILSFGGPPERPVAVGDPDVITLESSESDEERSSAVKDSTMIEGEVNAEERNLTQQGENTGEGGSTTEMSDEEETEFNSAEEYPLESLNASLAVYAQNKTNKSGVKRDLGNLIFQSLIGKDGKESAVAAAVEVFQVAETDDTSSDDCDGIPPKRPRLGAFCSHNNLIMGKFNPVKKTNLQETIGHSVVESTEGIPASTANSVGTTEQQMPEKGGEHSLEETAGEISDTATTVDIVERSTVLRNDKTSSIEIRDDTDESNQSTSKEMLTMTFKQEAPENEEGGPACQAMTFKTDPDSVLQEIFFTGLRNDGDDARNLGSPALQNGELEVAEVVTVKEEGQNLPTQIKMEEHLDDFGKDKWSAASKENATTNYHYKSAIQLGQTSSSDNSVFASGSDSEDSSSGSSVVSAMENGGSSTDDVEHINAQMEIMNFLENLKGSGPCFELKLYRQYIDTAQLPSVVESQVLIFGPTKLVSLLEQQLSVELGMHDNISCKESDELECYLNKRTDEFKYMVYMMDCDSRLDLKTLVSHLNLLKRFITPVKRVDFILCRSWKNTTPGYPSLPKFAQIAQKFNIFFTTLYHDVPKRVELLSEYCASRYRKLVHNKL